MKPHYTVALMALLAAAAVQADEPKDPAPAATSATEAPAVASKSAEQIAADEKAKADKERERQAWGVKQMRAAGYKPQTKKDGTVLWCRNETPIGSHLEQQRCSTMEMVMDTQKKGQDMTSDMFQKNNRGPQSNN